MLKSGSTGARGTGGEEDPTMTRRQAVGFVLALAGLVLALAPPLAAAVLPAHRALRVLVVSDEVNPHGLPPGSLTQPGEIAAALVQPGAGLRLDPAADGVREI